MITTFQSDSQKELFDATTQELESIGYSGDLLEIDYRFPDYFRAGVPERTAAAAAFGQTPPSYRTACFGVLVAGQNSHEGKNLVESCRALGAPLHFEVRLDRVALWIVGKDGQTTRVRAEYTKSELHQAFKQHIDQWSPSSILRAKNIGFAPTPQQLDFFDLGLIPALEAQIEEKLDPILRNALAAAQRAYKKTAMAKADGRDLFRLAFRLLAGKIFHDRGVTGFASLTQDDGPDAVLQLVAKHYGETFPKLLNQSAREAAFERIWSGLDFKNLSIDILTAIWSKTLVTKEVRTGLGIHTTPRAVASYVVNRLPRESFIDLKQTAGLVVEPCCGSATFLVEAMQRIRDELPRSMSPQQRHAYFQNVLVGVETETFGVEVARLCLTLADFPNPNGWRIYEENVFTSPHLPESLSNARVVLCNPPFQTMETDDPLRDHVESFHKPAEILRRVLHNLHPQGVLGFVLPRTFIDGAWYRQTRAELVRRFAELELVSLPDIAFRGSESQHETVLLLATGPRQNGQSCSVRHRRVDKGNWDEFRQFGKPTSDDESIKTVGEAEQSLAVPQLGEVWSRLAGLSKLGEIAKISKGIEWNLPLIKGGMETGNRSKFIFDAPQSWTREGVPPLAKIQPFQKPTTMHLSMRPEDQRRGAYKKLPWDTPKVILNAARRSRGPWRISAFADFDGLTCYRTFLAVWPKDPILATVLAAVLNGPVANAFAALREGPYIPTNWLKLVPVPKFSASQRTDIEKAVSAYVTAASVQNWQVARDSLRLVDALVLRAYDLPPRVERKLLDYFRGHARAVPFDFGDYFPADFKPFFSLADYISDDFRRSTAGVFRSLKTHAPEQVLKAMDYAAESYREE